MADKLYMYAYANYSESAKLLADKLDVWLIKHEKSTFKGEDGQFILNWGAGTGIFNANVGHAKVLNPPELIDIAVNKRDYFYRAYTPNGPRLPMWTTQRRHAKEWCEEGYTIIARTMLEGCKGTGLVVCKKPLDIPDAGLYTIKVENVVDEYRVYMFEQEVLDYRVKKGKKVDDMVIGEGIDFLIDHRPLPDDVILQCQKAAKRLPLMTQGIDVLWDGKKAWVLETNTAPYLGIQVANKYAKRINEFLKEAA